MADKYVDIDTLKYMLYDVHKLEDLLERERFVDHDKESLDMFLESTKDFADRELFPFIKEMDEKPAYHKDGKVYVHSQVETMMKKGGELGFISASFDYDIGGMQIPLMAHTAATYILDAANNHLPGYAGLTQGAAELIIHFASKDLLETFVPNMLSGKWGGTMCLTEPQAGSSLSDIITKAKPTQNGYYNITGQKIFISGGDNQFAENIVHLVLARVEGAAKGTKGISLFIVPKNRNKSDGTLESNDVTTVADFQKMGQKGYCTTHLGFGDKDDCKGWLVGEENQGLNYMFLMMNAARIAVGRGSSAIASAAYYASLQYANERPQGRKLASDGKKNIEQSQSLIIEHPDVRRMLLLQKAVVEGSMSLVLLAAKYYDLESTAKSKEEKIKYNTLLEMIIPVVKTYPSEAGAYSVNNGLQVLGGYGFCSDFILQQYYRDIRISSIYEGTTGIQSQDLLGRKITMNNGEGLKLLLNEILTTVAKANNHPELKPYADSISEKIKLSEKVLTSLMPHALKGDFEKYLADASVFMEFFSLIIVAWNWLEIATYSQEALVNGDKKYSEIFYNSKIETMKYFFDYELPKTVSHSEILMNPSSVTIKKDEEILI
ncbi:acyl-CoA dehydrogenase [Flavobacteriaceae bacterium]|nr:acyl-CoA dehydrogenase [Flavobacteriaceae bacterium]MDB4239998.1 acyl-CoA dehydrogenase [Flavobacteriaceae bacterium]MDB9787666.1 acyl-CoA dehydrogenase [Flavobacteriaceae bacterium]MDB9902018.1 acyl-CoA dehydrogenase [Flavobacteriaceae bacterium]MDC0958138.1 acyl-CoA dehydrogenase [Flavobacteriaceae bacterium]